MKQSIIVPTYNHPENLRRLLLYYSEFPFHIIFADGSENPPYFPPSGHLNRLRFTYFNIPGAQTLLQRLLRAVELVETEFFIFLDDGDIIFGSSLNALTKFLETNPDTNFVAGRMGFWIPNVVTKEGFRINLFQNASHWSSTYSVGSNSPKERMLDMIRNKRSANFFYTLCRTSKLIAPLKRCLRLKISSADPVELIWCGFLAGAGSLSLQNTAFWMRGNTPPVPHEKFGDGIPRRLWTKDSYPEEYDAAVLFLIEEIERLTSMKLNRPAIDEYFDLHLNYDPVIGSKLVRSASLTNWAGTILERNLLSEEYNDLYRFEAIVTLFPNGISDDQFSLDGSWRSA